MRYEYDDNIFEHMAEDIRRKIDADILESIRGLAETQPIDADIFEPIRSPAETQPIDDNRCGDDKYLDRIGYKK